MKMLGPIPATQNGKQKLKTYHSFKVNVKQILMIENYKLLTHVCFECFYYLSQYTQRNHELSADGSIANSASQFKMIFQKSRLSVRP